MGLAILGFIYLMQIFRGVIIEHWEEGKKKRQDKITAEQTRARYFDK